MWRYLKAAFWAGPQAPLIGTLPINVLLVAAAVIFGFVEPAVWPLALGAETLWLFTLATNRRFQRLVDGERLVDARRETEVARGELLTRLPQAARARLAEQEAKRDRILALRRDVAETSLIDADGDALRRLLWLYLKLLVARNHLGSERSEDSPHEITARMTMLVRESEAPDVDPAVRDSKRATADLLRQRVKAIERRGRALAQTDSDLARIEAQLDLALENAGLRESPQSISTDLDVLSDLYGRELAGGDVFGTDEAIVAEVERGFASPAPTQRPAQTETP